MAVTLTVSAGNASVAGAPEEVLRVPGASGPLMLELADALPAEPTGGLLALASIYDLHLAPLATVGPVVHWQHDPTIAALRVRLEAALEESLDEWSRPLAARLPGGPDDPVAAIRAIAVRDRVSPVYDWLAESAGWEELVEFIALEGGPDDGFDDLVAICQVGLPAGAKLALARNYWDEMGNGSPSAVHRELHRRLTTSLGLSAVPRHEMSEVALARSLLGGLLATNRRLQPEMVGALGMTELQAGPRCRRVVQALERLGAPGRALPFYEEHARTDPRHGRDWMDNAVAPLAEQGWGAGMIRGAAWRVAVNQLFFAELAARFEM